MSDTAVTGHRIAVISDTHNLLRPEVAEVIKTCDVVLHGGDISGPETLEKIRIACAKSTSSMVGGTPSERIGGAGNFYVVRGNNDRDWAADIPYKLEAVIYGRKFFMTHKKRDIPEDVDADVVIYGHSHRYAQDYFDGTLYLNPGSCGPRRFNQAITMAVLTIPDLETGSSEGGGSKASPIVVERIDIPHEPAASAKKVRWMTSSTVRNTNTPRAFSTPSPPPPTAARSWSPLRERPLTY